MSFRTNTCWRFVRVTKPPVGNHSSGQTPGYGGSNGRAAQQTGLGLGPSPGPMLVYCWANVVDGAPIVNQRLANVSCFLGEDPM